MCLLCLCVCRRKNTMARQTTKTAPKVGMPLHVPTSVYVATNETTASWKVRCETLATLTVPSKSIVDQLCGWAHEYRHVPDAAAEIARQLQFHLDTVWAHVHNHSTHTILTVMFVCMCICVFLRVSDRSHITWHSSMFSTLS